jgi:hypothetical protein
MKRLKAVTVVALMASMTCVILAQEQGYWKASSKTASSITGDISLTNDRLTINQFYFTPIAEIRMLKPEEVSSVFDVPADSPVNGRLYRLNIPGSHTFQHKNRMCGSSDVQWMAVRVEGKELNLAFFSSATPPVFTRDAIANSTDLCGTFVYSR